MDIKQKDGYAFIEKAEKEGMTITLKHKYGKHGGKCYITPVYDEVKKRHLGIDHLSQEKKEASSFYIDEKSSFVTYDGQEIDLSDKLIRKYWEMIKYSPRVAFTLKDAERTDALFYVFSAEKNSEENVNKESLLYSVKKLIFEDDPKNLSMRIKFLGVDMEGDSSKEMLDYLLSVANSSPSKILDIYDEKKNVARTLFYKGLSSGKIYKDRDLYIYNGTNLGRTETEAVLLLNGRDQGDLLDKLDSEINGVKATVIKTTDKPVINMKNDELIEFIGNKYELTGDEKRQELISIASKLK